ncbi:hypothetical protein KEJ45_06930 [Candidatus Bathyarchaeota archaeon]|nr:hypothetical protein [Candidatus Bathyarchaeota archaeon]
MTQARRGNSFEKAFLEAVDEGLSMLGESGRDVVYLRLQTTYAIKREDIISNLEIFAQCLRKIFGSGAEVIEKAIIKSLYGKLGMKFVEKKGYGFLEYLNEAKSAVAVKEIHRAN